MRNILHSWWVRPSRRERELATALAGALDAINQLAYWNDQNGREEALEKLRVAKKHFHRYLDEAYPMTANVRAGSKKIRNVNR